MFCPIPFSHKVLLHHVVSMLESGVHCLNADGALLALVKFKKLQTHTEMKGFTL